MAGLLQGDHNNMVAMHDAAVISIALGMAGGNGHAKGMGLEQKRRLEEVYKDGDLGTGSDETGIKIKKTRQSQSCDACRARKVKCDRPPPGSKSHPGEIKETCTHCEQLGLPCTFDYKPKKRGPPNLYLRKLQSNENLNPTTEPVTSQVQSYPSVANQVTNPEIPFSAPASSNLITSYEIPSNDYYRNGFSQERGRDIDVNGGPGPGTLAIQNGFQNGGLSRQTEIGINGTETWNPTLAIAIANQQSTNLDSSITTLPTGLSPVPHLFNASVTNSINHISPTTFATSPFTTYPSNPLNPFDQVLPRALLYQIIGLFFDYTYCLVPCLHKPTFMRDLNGRREERPGEEEWTALVYVVISTTLVQIPRAFVSMPRREVKALAEKCHRLTRDYLNKDFKTVTVTRCITLYLTSFTSYALDLRLVGETAYAANHGMSMKLRLHDEESYRDLSPVERELRRRIFWLQYGGDKTMAAIEGTPVFWHEDDCPDVKLPVELDDEYITEDAYLEQPASRTSVLSGFYYISKLFRLTGQILDKRRHDRRKPPSGLMLQMRMNEVDELFDQVMGLMDDCPEALRLDIDLEARTSISEDWDAHASADIRQLFLDPKASRATVKDGFLVQQANIYVTQQMVRYIIIQYRDELLALQQAEILAQSTLGRTRDSWTSNRPTRRQSSARRLGGDKALFSEEEKDQVASDLLTILQRIPIQVIAVNGGSLVSKVRFVASTLLDALSNPPITVPINAEAARASQRTVRAQNYLWDFLRVLSEIEKLYVLSDDDEETPPDRGGAC